MPSSFIPTTPYIRVLVIDHNCFTRMGVAMVLNAEKDIHVIGEADCATSALDLFAQHAPDVALIDDPLPDVCGTELARELLSRSKHARLLMLSRDETEEDVCQAAQVGVLGYMKRNTPPKELVHAVRTVAAGNRVFSQTALERLRLHQSLCPLSAREVQVLQGMARGWPNKMIAAEMGVSVETVKTFATRIRSKLSAENRAQSVMKAIERGFLKRA